MKNWTSGWCQFCLAFFLRPKRGLRHIVSDLETYDYTLGEAPYTHGDKYRIANANQAKCGCAYLFDWINYD